MIILMKKDREEREKIDISESVGLLRTNLFTADHVGMKLKKEKVIINNNNNHRIEERSHIFHYYSP